MLPGCVLLPRDPEPDRVTLAADCLDRDDGAGAVVHFTAHVKVHPEQVMFRAYLAEQLFRLKRFDLAAAHFERFIADAQPMTGAPHEHLVHCHTRLTTMAAARGDGYREGLNRGISLLQLAAGWPDDEQRRMALRKAAGALREALDERPGCPRAYYYLAMVYERLGQPASAEAARTAARNGPPCVLTEFEKAQLLGK